MVGALHCWARAPGGVSRRRERRADRPPLGIASAGLRPVSSPTRQAIRPIVPAIGRRLSPAESRPADLPPPLGDADRVRGFLPGHRRRLPSVVATARRRSPRSFYPVWAIAGRARTTDAAVRRRPSQNSPVPPLRVDGRGDRLRLGVRRTTWSTAGRCPWGRTRPPPTRPRPTLTATRCTRTSAVAAGQITTTWSNSTPRSDPARAQQGISYIFCPFSSLSTGLGRVDPVLRPRRL